MSLRSSAFENNIFAITLFTDDMNASARFYGGLLGLDDIYRDDASIVYKCGGTLINLLNISQAPELISPAPVGAQSHSRAVYTLKFEKIDALVADLISSGVPILNGPVVRPWGVRTVSVQDPSGHIWEFANH